MSPLLLLLTIVCSTGIATCLELEAIQVAAKLPKGRYQTSAIYDDEDSIYILGGRDDREFFPSIWKYSISNDTMQEMPSMPRASYAGTVTSDNQGHIYYIGGYRTDMQRNIFRYVPANGSITTVAYNSNNYFCSTVKYNETSAYILGGYYYPAGITHFNTETRETTFVRDLTPDRYYNAAFSDGRGTAYIIGNPRSQTWGYHSVEVLDMYSLESRFGPANFPAIREQKATAVWDGRYAYVIGAFANASAEIGANGVFQFDPETMGNTFVPVRNFPGHDNVMYTAMSAVYVPKLHRIYLIGGRTTTYEILDAIFFMDLPPLPTVLPSSAEPTTELPTSASPTPSITITTTTESVSNPTTGSTPDDLEAILVGAKLPRRTSDASSYYDGDDFIYIFGGSDGGRIHSEILKYSISNDVIEQVASLPRASYRGTVTGDMDGNMYYVTGYRASNEMETLIFRYVPTNGSVSTFAYTQRDYDCDTVKVNDTSSYTFGGFYFSSRIMHLNMESRETSVLGELLQRRYYQAAFSDGNGNAYIFGNMANQDGYHPVEKLNMYTLESTLSTHNFPAIRNNKPAAVWNGRYGFLMGVFGSDVPMDGILRFHPETMSNAFLPVKNFPGQRGFPFTSTSIVYVPKLDRIYMIGGKTLIPFNDTCHDSIWYIQLSNKRTDPPTTTEIMTSPPTATLTSDVPDTPPVTFTTPEPGSSRTPGSDTSPVTLTTPGPDTSPVTSTTTVYTASTVDSWTSSVTEAHNTGYKLRDAFIFWYMLIFISTI